VTFLPEAATPRKLSGGFCSNQVVAHRSCRGCLLDRSFQVTTSRIGGRPGVRAHSPLGLGCGLQANHTFGVNFGFNFPEPPPPSLK